jgi:DNA-binding transcriptional LysR family regulator
VNLLPGQDVLTVSSTQAKVEAHLRCMGCGFLPEPLARPHIEAGRFVVKAVQRPRHTATFGYAWRATSNQDASLGLGLQWWLQQLQSSTTRKALLERHRSQCC